MGMFNHIRYEDSLPNGFDGRDCQTKSLDCELTQYVVKDGLLYRKENLLFERPGGFAEDVTGDIEFCGINDSKEDPKIKTLTTYRAEVVNGKVSDVKLIEKFIFRYDNYEYKNGCMFYIVTKDEIGIKEWIDCESGSRVEISDVVKDNDMWVLIREVPLDGGLFKVLPRTAYPTYEEALQFGQDWFIGASKGIVNSENSNS